MRLTLIILTGFFGLMIYDTVNTTYTKKYGKIIDYPACSADTYCRARVQFLNEVRVVKIRRRQNPLIDDEVTLGCNQSPIRIDSCEASIGRH